MTSTKYSSSRRGHRGTTLKDVQRPRKKLGTYVDGEVNCTPKILLVLYLTAHRACNRCPEKSDEQQAEDITYPFLIILLDRPIIKSGVRRRKRTRKAKAVKTLGGARKKKRGKRGDG